MFQELDFEHKIPLEMSMNLRYVGLHIYFDKINNNNKTMSSLALELEIAYLRILKYEELIIDDLPINFTKCVNLVS